MPCYYPVYGYKRESGGITFNPRDGQADNEVALPCGRCIGCKLARSQEWAIRCMHEASMWEQNSFITLTYSDEHLPATGSLDNKILTRTFRKMRKNYGLKFKYFACGEYGDNFGRPHYHAILFGIDFEDKVPINLTDLGDTLYRSERLEKIWPYGLSSIGAVTFESAAYVARYCTKKITGPLADEHYQRVNTETGEIHKVHPEFMRCSLNPAIGREWFDKFKPDTHKGFITRNGKKLPLPKYYLKLLEKAEKSDDTMEEQTFSRLKEIRRQAVDKSHIDMTYDRLVTREKVKQLRIKSLKRDMQ